MHNPRYYTLDLFRLSGIFTLLFGILLVGGTPASAAATAPQWIAQVANYTKLGAELLALSFGFSLAIRAERQSTRSYVAWPVAQGVGLVLAYCALSAATSMVTGGWAVVFDLPSKWAALATSPSSAQLGTSALVLAYSWVAAHALGTLTLLPHVVRFRSKYMTGALLVSLTVLANAHPETGSPLPLLRMLTLADYLPYLVAGFSFHRLMRNRAVVWDMYNLCFAYMLAMKSVGLHCAELAASHQGSPSAVIAQIVVTLFFGAFFLFSTGKLYRLNHPAAQPLVRPLNLAFVTAAFVGIPAARMAAAHTNITLATLFSVFAVIASTFVLYRVFEYPLLKRAKYLG